MIRTTLLRASSLVVFAVPALAVSLSLSLGAAGCNHDDPPPQAQNAAATPPPPPGYPQQPGYPPPGYPQQPPPGYPQQAYPQQPPPGYPQQQPGYPQQPPPGYPQQQPAYPPPPPPGYPQQPSAGPLPPPQPPQPTAPSAPPAPAPGAPWALPTALPTMPLPAPSSAPSSPAATPIDPNFAGAATLPLQTLAAQEAPGMQKEGAILAGQFQEGQALEQAVNLQPNRCYTVVAVGIGIQETDLTLALTTPIPNMNPILARDTGTGPQASLGGKGNCYRWPMPLPGQAKIIVRASKGAGLAAAQLFSK